MFCNNCNRQDGYGDIDINITNQNANMNTNMVDVNDYQMAAPQQMGYGAVVETPQERCVHRTFVHEVPHVCPINTKIINHHIYKHTYQPRYTCSEENVVSEQQCGSCCQYR